MRADAEPPRDYASAVAPRIVTLTLNPTVDETASVGQVVPDRKLRLTSPVREPGGGGLNVARAAMELGEPALAVWARGGHAGELLEELLAAHGLPFRAVPVRGTTRTSLVVLETSTGRQYRFVLPGPTLEEDELRAVLEAATGLEPPPEFLVASGSLPAGVDPRFYARLAAAARPATRVVVDTSGEPLRHALAAGVFLVKPNLRELSSLAGRPLESDGAIEEAACALARSGGAEIVLASLGAGGAVLAWAGGCERIHAPTVPVQSKVGAGDSAVAATVVGLARGMGVPAAARYGVAAGAAAVMTPGTELCRRADVDRLFAEIDRAPPRRATE
jgi:6-phosphofructokinase 2